HARIFGWPRITPIIAITVTIGFIMIFATGVNRARQVSDLTGRLISRPVRTASTVVMFHGVVLSFVHSLGLHSISLGDLLVRFGITLTTAFAVCLLINMSPAARVLSGVPRERPLRVTIAA